MKNLFFLLVIFPFILFSQKNQTCYQVDYQQKEEEKTRYKIKSILSCKEKIYLSDYNNNIKTFLDLNRKEYITTINYNDTIYKHSISFDELPKPIIIKNTKEKILGYDIKYAKYSYFSNLIEVWFTENSKAKGSLYGKFLPTKDALVLKIAINKGFPIIVSKIHKKKIPEDFLFLPVKAKEKTASEFENIKIKSRFTTLPIFKNEQINFDPSLKLPNKDSLKNNITYRLSKGTVILKRIKMKDKLKNSEYIFATLKVQSNGDAYDRTGSVFILPKLPKKSMLTALLQGTVKDLPKFIDKRGFKYQGIRREKNYEPITEIMRFFTPFGVGHFNHKRAIDEYKWKNSVTYKHDITNLIPTDENEFWIGVFIGNYDKGGHKVNLDLNIYPKNDSNIKKRDKFILPLFSTVNIMEMSGQNYGKLFKTDTLTVEFSLPKNIEDIHLLYTSTGHGGWDTGDEFVPRQNKVIIDNKEVFNVIPWRTDCASYRLSNPASGNFNNGMSSSDYSRSNWCPGMLTYPYFIKLNNLKTGRHIIQIVINQGNDSNKSHNHWNVTGVLTGNIKQ